MSTAAVSSSSLFQEVQSFYQTRQADVKHLGSALQSGDLNGAQQAYKALAVLGEDGPFANSEPFSKSSRAQAFNAIGEALQAGDLTRAQAAFAPLTSKPSDSATSSQATAAAVANLSSTQPSSASTTSSAAASASSIYQQLQAYRQQRQADLTQLGQDLQAGDLNSAQQDFNTLSALGQSGPY
jgi:Skp family chaperone for outer membrane proteins